MQKQDLLLKNATIINEGKILNGHLLIKNGKIEALFYNQAAPVDENALEVIDTEGCWVIPGVIDDQVHFREPGLTHKADLFTESRAAVAGGITSFMEMPNTIPQTISQDTLQSKFRMAQERSVANYSFYIGATNDNIDALLATDKKHVCGIKVFMGSSTGNMLVDNPNSLNKIFRIKRIPIATHCEDESTIRENLAIARNQYGHNIPVSQHPVIRSREACVQSTRLAISLAERRETRLHLLHLSTRDEMRLLDNSIPLSQKLITAEVCIHHLIFTQKDYETKGSLIKWNPAIKDESDNEALWKALNRGQLDVVATDHAPHTLEEKQRSYLECPSGGPMVQHALPAMLEAHHQGKISLEKIVETMCHNPAICFNIKNRGFIREGFAADLVVISPNNPHMVDKKQLLYKCKWSPFEGHQFTSKVLYTFINGVKVYEKGTIHDTYRGEALEFSR